MAKKRASKQNVKSYHESQKLHQHKRNGLEQPTEDHLFLPPAFPRTKDLLMPTTGFLRNEGICTKAFQVALDTTYEGFAYDTSSSEQGDGEIFPHTEIQKSLLVMDGAGLFRADVTQPFGLGTKCAKTYVTRCLLGDEGTTYKYLGLRMFSHPWNGNVLYGNKVLKEAIGAIAKLNETLTDRAKAHLKDLEQKRLRRGICPPVIKGRVAFDVALINKMQSTSELKLEPMFHNERCSVSWHADSSLEHYSTIAVYHTITGQQNKKDARVNDSTSSGDCDWSVALRVVHNAEGPAASRRGADISSSIAAENPPIAISLSSGSAYYMLDDHNHHHQHAVIAPKEGNPGVRFSSTHRLLREGHTVQFIIGRCAAACANFHRKGPKLWRSEQLLLLEIEFEWLRQFYIQGEEHKTLLWKVSLQHCRRF